MKTRIIVIYIIILSSSVMPDDIFSPLLVILGFSIFINNSLIIPRHLLTLLKPLIAVLTIGIIGITGNETRHILRDVIYALTPISILYIGYWLASERTLSYYVFKHIVILGILLSVIHIGNFIVDPTLLYQDLEYIRKNTYNPGSGTIVLALFFSIYAVRFELNKLTYKFLNRYLVISILLISFVFSFSRTNIIMAIVLCMAQLRFFTELNTKFFITLLTIFGGLFFLTTAKPGNEEYTLQSKFTRSVKEIRITDYERMSDIHNNWRGFETYLAVKKFTDGSIIEKIKGFGFGSLIDLGFTTEISNIKFSKIPILHNGYAYVLIKTGILGLFAYFIFYYRVIRIGFVHYTDRSIAKLHLSRLLSGIIISLMLSMIVVGGMAEIHHTEYVLLVGYIFRLLK